MDKQEKNLFIKTASEFISLSPSEVVKSASLLRRIKNIWKQFLDPKYKEKVQELAASTSGLSEFADNLSKSLKDLSSSLIDSDIESYDKNLSKTKQQLSDLIKILKLNNDTIDIISKKETKENKEVVKDIKKINKNDMPEGFDIEPSKDFPELAGKKMSEYVWLNKIKDQSIYKSNTVSKVFFSTLKKSISKLDKEANEIIKTNIDNIWANFEKAVFAGILLRAGHFKEFKEFKAIPLAVATAPFDITGLNIRVKAYVTLNDVRTSLSRNARLSLRETTKIEVLHIPFINKEKEADKVDSEEVDEYDPRDVDNDIYSHSRIDYLKHLIKNAVNTNAYKDFPKQFWIEFVNMCKRLSMNPKDLAQVIWTESGFDPSAINYQNGHPVAKGLNQLIEKGGLILGMTKEQWGNYEHLSALEQLPFVESFFRRVGNATGTKKWNSSIQLYVANFAPKYVNKANNPNTVLYPKYNDDGAVSEAYKQNKGLDRDNKGYININDLQRFVTTKLPNELLSLIDNAQNGLGVEMPENDVDQLVTKLVEPVPANDNNIDQLVTKLVAKKYPLTNLIKKAIFNSEVFVIINGGSQTENIEFARAASNLSNKFLKLDSSVFIKENDVQMILSGPGSKQIISNAVNSLLGLLSNKFTRKTGNYINFSFDRKEAGTLIDDEFLINNNRKFNLEQLVK